ncbi:hypothetical protein ACKWTF_009015 [Chironomus riparius]
MCQYYSKIQTTMLTILLLLFIVAITYYYLKWNYDFWQVRGVPFEKPVLFFGNFKKSITRLRHVSEDFTELYNKYKGTANFIGIFQMREPRIMVIEPKLVNEVLIRKFNHFSANEFSKIFNPKIDPLFTRNPFLASGDSWKEYRSEIATAFSSVRLRTMYPIMESVVDNLHSQVIYHINQPFEARELSLRFTADIVSNCIFNLNSDCLSGCCKVRTMSKKLSSPPKKTVLFMIIAEIFPICRKFLPMKFITDDVEEFFLDFFERSMRLRKRTGIKVDDFLDYVISLREKKKLSHKDVAGHLTTFFSDGLETTSLLIAHTLYELANNEGVQCKLRDEINRYIDTYDEISYDVLNEMAYLELVIAETLRLHPPFTIISKECTSDVRLEVTKGRTVLIEKGTNVYIPLYQIQNDPEYFPKPKEFIPERCSHHYSYDGLYLPFGNGTRQCLGMKFASMACKAAVVQLVKNFKITVNSRTSEELRIDPNEFLNIKKGGLWLNFKPVHMFQI